MVTNSSARVLVLDGQTTQALSCVRSLGRAGHTVFVASHLPRPLASWSRFCRSRYRVLGESLEAFASLRTWAAQHGVTHVFPLTERSCVLCNVDRREWEAADMVVGCGTADMLERAFDKAQTVRDAQACGVRIPTTRAPESLEECHAAANELGFPLVVKSRSSNAWDGTRFAVQPAPGYVKHVAALDQTVAAHSHHEQWPLIQQVVDGRGVGVFALCDQGRPVAWFAHERLRDQRPSGSGSSLRRAIPLDPRLKEPAQRLIQHLRWHGPIMVEFRDDGVTAPCLIEINGRFWGSLELAVAAGVDFPRLWLEILEGRPVHTVEEYRHGTTVRWLWGDVKRLLHTISGPPPGYPGTYPSVWQVVRELLGRQPLGTRLECWQSDDWKPGVGQWVQGVHELTQRFRGQRRGANGGGTRQPATPDCRSPATPGRSSTDTALDELAQPKQ